MVMRMAQKLEQPSVLVDVSLDPVLVLFTVYVNSDHFGPRHSRIKNGNGACKFSFSAISAQKVNLRPMEFAYRAPVVGIVDANLAIL